MNRSTRAFRRATGLPVLAVAAFLLTPVGPARLAGAQSAKCPTPPVDVTIQPGAAGAASASDLRVTDAVARRVPIVPQEAGSTTGDPKALAKLQKQAARTSLALYSVYLADFDVPRDQLRGFGFGDVTPPSGKTVATLTLVPTAKRGFVEGDVVRDGELRYESTTTFAPVSLIVKRPTGANPPAYDAVSGQVRIRELDAKSICVDMAIDFTRSGQVVSSIEGAVRAPVVKAGKTFFFT